MRILLVDDDDLSRDMLAEILNDLSDHEIIECSNAVEGLDCYFADPYPIVITDIHMPGYSGLELLREIKNSPSGKDTDVIVITGLASMDNAIEALREGATDFLRKPIDFTQLLDIISKIVVKQTSLDGEVNGDKLASSHKINSKTFDFTNKSKLPQPSIADPTKALSPGEIHIPQNSFCLDSLILEIVQKTLSQFEGNQTKAAAHLSLSRGKLRTYIERLK